MSEKIIQLFISKTMENMVNLAEGTMNAPPEDPFRFGQLSGRYQGMRMALDILDSVLRDSDEKERNS